MFTTKNLFTLVGKHLLITFGVIAFAVTVIFLISKQITKVSVSTMRDRSLATTLRERTTLLSSLKHEVEIVGSNETIINHAFIPSNDILEFVAILESLALKSGVTQTFRFSSPIPQTTGTLFPLSIIGYQNTVSSNISTFINYLKEFEKLPYFTKIDSLNISSGVADWRSAATISFTASVGAQTAK